MCACVFINKFRTIYIYYTCVYIDIIFSDLQTTRCKRSKKYTVYIYKKYIYKHTYICTELFIPNFSRQLTPKPPIAPNPSKPRAPKPPMLQLLHRPLPSLHLGSHVSNDHADECPQLSGSDDAGRIAMVCNIGMHGHELHGEPCPILGS